MRNDKEHADQKLPPPADPPKAEYRDANGELYTKPNGIPVFGPLPGVEWGY